MWLHVVFFYVLCRHLEATCSSFAPAGCHPAPPSCHPEPVEGRFVRVSELMIFPSFVFNHKVSLSALRQDDSKCAQDEDRSATHHDQNFLFNLCSF